MNNSNKMILFHIAIQTLSTPVNSKLFN